MRNSITLIFILALATNPFTMGQGVNGITIQPSSPTASDTVMVISDFSYYGNCVVGLVSAQIQQSGSVVTIYPEYCGFGDTTLCNSVDTFSIDGLSTGNYILNIEYHQGTVCAGGFDAIIAYVDTTLQVGTLSTSPINSNETKISVFPNPTSDIVELRSEERIIEVKLLDITGRESRLVSKGNTIDIRLLDSGIYILIVEMENGLMATQKIVKNSAR